MNKPLNPWQPEQDKIRLAVLGKLGEELGECSAIVSRCIIQGIHEFDPVTKENNKTSLENEIADVYATIEDAIDLFDLKLDGIYHCAFKKRIHLAKWRKLLDPSSS